MFINYEMATIELTKAEAKEAGVFKSDMYNVLTEVREATGFKVVVKESKRKRDTLKGLTYAYMEVYIEKKAGERKEELQAELNVLRGYVDGKRDILKEKSSYGEVREWFLNSSQKSNHTMMILIKRELKHVRKKNVRELKS